MAMNFDTYNTSFQSLMNPMYNVNANYTYGMGGGAGAYGAGCMNPAMMGMYAMGPMAGVGVGQFKADYLVKGDDQMNNYYARPIATHKKKDELPTILGILGTALGTAALIAALAKGRGRKIPGPVAPKPPLPPVTITPDLSKFGKQPYVAPKYLNPNTVATDADKFKQQIRYGLNNPAPSVKPDVSKFGQQPYVAPKYLNPNTVATEADKFKQQIRYGLNQPYTPVIKDVPPSTSGIKGYLPQYTSKMQAALDKQAAAMNLPSSGKVYTTPVKQGQAVAGYLPAPGQGGLPVSTKVNLKPIEEYYNNPAFKIGAGQAEATAAQGGLPAVIGSFPAKTNAGVSDVTILNPYHKAAKPVLHWKSGAEDVAFEEVAQGGTRLLGSQTPFKGLPAPTLTRQQAALEKQAAAMNLPSSGIVYQQDGFIRPVITRKGNRFANINGAKIQNRMATVGLQLDTQAFAKLPKALHREFNNIILNGTDAQLKAITCDPRFENVFKIA